MMDYYTMCPEHGGSYGTTCEKCKIGEVERMATFVQLAMNEAREEAEQKCATLRARVAELEAALRGWDSLLGMPRAKLFAELKAATRAALSSPPPHDGEGKP